MNVRKLILAIVAVLLGGIGYLYSTGQIDLSTSPEASVSATTTTSTTTTP